jgi:hypothetical protein
MTKTFLLEHRYIIGNVDKTIFTLKHVTDFLFLQLYVDDIIFGGSSHTLVFKFEEIMENNFQMFLMEELIFFLDIQMKQIKEDVIIH